MGRRCQWNGRHLVRIDLVSIDDVCARVIRQRNHLSCQAGGTTNRHAQLQTAATLEGLGKMLERKIMNTYHHGTRRHRRPGELHVQDVNWVSSELRAECEWNSNQRRMRKGRADSEVGPTVLKSFNCFFSGDVQRVEIDVIYFGEGFDQITGVGFISRKSGSY